MDPFQHTVGSEALEVTADGGPPGGSRRLDEFIHRGFFAGAQQLANESVAVSSSHASTVAMFAQLIIRCDHLRTDALAHPMA